MQQRTGIDIGQIKDFVYNDQTQMRNLLGAPHFTASAINVLTSEPGSKEKCA
jgi:hypothetical protein